MGDLTYTDMYNEVLVEVVQRDDIDTVISNALYQAYQDVATTFHHFETEKIVTASMQVGVYRYVLPADLRVILSVRDDTQGRKLTKEDWRIFEEMSSRSTGDPSRYARFGRYLELDTLPDSANVFILRYAQIAARMSGSMTTILANEWDEAIILGAIYRTLQRIKQYDQAEIAKNRYLEFVQSRTQPKDLEDEDVDESLGVRVSQ